VSPKFKACGVFECSILGTWVQVQLETLSFFLGGGGGGMGTCVDTCMAMGCYCNHGVLSNVPRFVVSQINFGMGQAGMSNQQKLPRLSRLTRIKKPPKKVVY
jgi:hypothetical protein